METPAANQNTPSSLNYLSLRIWVISLTLLVTLVVSGLYFINLVKWGNGPDFGWAISYELGGLRLVEVTGGAQQVGLRAGDYIQEVNGHLVSSYRDMREVLSREVPGTNEYVVRRDGELYKFRVANEPLGFSGAFIKFGLTWLLGLLFVILGATVFFMKPSLGPPLTFLGVMISLFLYVTFSFTSKLVPDWLGHAFTLPAAVLPAAIIHLGQTFPVKQPWLRTDRSPILFIPYIVSILLFILMVSSAPIFQDVSGELKKAANIYLAVALTIYVLTMVGTFLRTRSAVTRNRTKMVLLGLVAGATVPIADVVAKAFFDKVLIGNPVFNIPFYLAIPLAIGYSITKHNLFDVDVYIKRAAGYTILTAIVASGYLGLQAMIQSLLVPVLGSAAESVLPIVYALMVVLLINPVSRRVQNAVDILFFRKKADYKETVLSIGESLSSVFKLEAIADKIIATIMNDMYVDSAGLLVMDRQKGICSPIFRTEDPDGNLHDYSSTVTCDPADPLMKLIDRERRLITKYDIEEDPRYQGQRGAFLQRFEAIGASLSLPLVHQNVLIGVLFLGYKKSGYQYDNDDIELLNTLTSQAAVAIENANLLERMQKEEEVRGNLARYLSPQIVDRVVSEGVELDLGGQRKEVSVLFSDIRDFTSISETWPPDQLVTILNEYMTDMVSVVFENKGSIDKFVGDAIVAVFGSLVEVENHAQHAVEGALGMVRRLPELNRKWQKEYGVGLKIGAGINSGEVFLGNIGSPDRMEFTVIGDAVNLAARLEGLTKFYSVELVISEFTHQRLKGILCRKLDLVLVKGKKKAVSIYEPVCLDSDAGDDLRAELATYEEALDAYYNQQWDQAFGVFNVLCSEHPNRGLYKLYLERIQNLRNTGLPENWDGVFVHTSK